MKRSAAILISTVVGLALTSCSSTANTAASTSSSSAASSAAATGSTGSAASNTVSSASGKKIYYGIPSPLATESGEHNINLGITCYADKIGAKVTTLDSNLDVNKQISDFDNLLAQQANVLPFLPLDPAAFTAPFQRAKDAGASVIELYNPKSTAPGSIYEDSATAGADAVKYVTEHMPAGGGKAILIGGPPIQTVTDRINGFADLAAAANIAVLEQSDNLKDNVNDARTLADTLFTKHPDATIVFAFNDNAAIGAGLSAQSRGMTGMLIFGINGTPEGIKAIKDGIITATYDADQWGMGYAAAQMGETLQNGGSVEPDKLAMKRWDITNADKWLPAEDRCAAVG